MHTDHLTMLQLSTKMNGRSLWLVIILASAFCCSSSTVGSSKIMCLDGERDALLRFKQGLVDETKTLASWKTDTDCCQWRGIACNNQTGHVITLDLSITDIIPLRGEVGPSLLELRYLSYLDLSFNDFGGTLIPKFIGSMSRLQQLKIADTNFSGPVPPQLGNLSNLYTLDLSENYYVSSENLEWLSHLSSLRYLNLERVDLSGVMNWPQSLSKLHSLIELQISNCDLTDVNLGSLSFINSSTSLQILNLSRNSLDSSIFYWIANLSSNFVHIDLSSQSFDYKLQGSIPDVFTNMVSLVYLDLSFNHFEGGIPKSFQNLCSLRSLLLGANQLSGNIEDTLETLSCSKNTLENLNLRFNQFWGTWPDFTGFSKLRELRLSNNQLNGSLPMSVGQLSSLEVLTLGSNSLIGVITEAHFSNLSRLHSLDISGNHYSINLSSDWSPPFHLEVLHMSYYNGSRAFPKWIQTQTNLTELYLSDVGVVTEAHFSNLSRLTGLGISGYLSLNLSSEWSPPFNLNFLDLSHHNGSQAFPKWIQTQTNLIELYMPNAGISDSIPDRFWNSFHRLEYLQLQENQIYGTLPNLSTTSLVVAEFYSNLFSGALPSFPPTLQFLALFNNKFSGPLSTLCESQPPRDLWIVNLFDNLLSGELPECWMVCQSIRYLNLGKNKLSGKVPSWLGGLQSLWFLMLQNNRFHGELPSLENCTDLTVLDLGDNNLSGNIPAWIGPRQTNLLYLRLRNNQLSGIIPLSLCSLATVHVLDLSGNNISGVLPYCFNNISALASDTKIVGDPMELVWKGIEVEFGLNVIGMRYIDMSSNYLVGEIPVSVTGMTKLISFNLSRNNLTGNLPENFGNLKMLESLDFSRNNLSGGIPSSFSRLNFLQVLDLSHNNLSGRIPLGTQLQSFNASSYAENSGLCGLPLTDICPGDDVCSHGTRGSESESKQVDHDDDGFISLGFFISMVLGFISGFWIVCGSLMLKSSWRFAYFRFLDSLCIPGTRIFKA